MEEEPSSKRLKVEGEPAVAEVAPISGADVKDVAAVAPPVENATLATLYENLDDDDEEDDGDFDDNGQQESDDDSIQSDADELDPVDDIPKGEESDASIDAPDRHVAAFLAAQRARGTEPSQLLRRFGYAVENTKEVSDDLLWHLIEQLLCDVRRVRSARCKLLDFNTLEDAVQLFQNSKNIVILTGAGVSVSCGIPDFRSKGGLYETIADEFDLPDPQALFDIHYFHDDPKPFFRFAKELMPGNYQPSLCHKFIKHLEDRGQLLRNYTQNIDTLENVAGIKRIIQCHGSFASATCTECKVQVPSHVIREDVMAQEVPICPSCKSGVMKPDIIFFGEKLPDVFDNALKEDREVVDLLVVIGSSLKVQPVASVIGYIPPNVPQILINREVVGRPNAFDIELLGNCDNVVEELMRRLNWSLTPTDAAAAPAPAAAAESDLAAAFSDITEAPVKQETFEFIAPNRYLFAGASTVEHRWDDGIVSGSDSDSEDDPSNIGFAAETAVVSAEVGAELAAVDAVPVTDQLEVVSDSVLDPTDQVSHSNVLADASVVPGGDAME